MGSATLSSVERLSFSRMLKIYYCYGKGAQKSVLCREFVPFSEGPLSEVPLYDDVWYENLPAVLYIQYNVISKLSIEVVHISPEPITNSVSFLPSTSSSGNIKLLNLQGVVAVTTGKPAKFHKEKTA